MIWLRRSVCGVDGRHCRWALTDFRYSAPQLQGGYARKKGSLGVSLSGQNGQPGAADQRTPSTT